MRKVSAVASLDLWAAFDSNWNVIALPPSKIYHRTGPGRSSKNTTRLAWWMEPSHALFKPLFEVDERQGNPKAQGGRGRMIAMIMSAVRLAAILPAAFPSR